MSAIQISFYITITMGPIIIFDKSTLESLSPDEAMWLDNFFLSNITPLFFIETLADLEKELKSGRTPEEVVGNLAYKTPDMSSRPNIHHMDLLTGELSGRGKVVMDGTGRPIISGGKALELEGKTGVIFQQPPEEEAFKRWQRREFLQLERLIAKAWRRSLSSINFEEKYQLFQQFFTSGKPKTLADVKILADLIIDRPDRENIFIFGLSLLDIPRHLQLKAIERWKAASSPSMRQFVPYFTHLFSVDLFFYLAIAADLIGRGRPSHKIDIAYLYYLPFCMVFTSNDKLHASTVPLFLRENQTFIPGIDLKNDLNKLDRHYDALPDEMKDRGVMSFAFYPPTDSSFLVSRLWDRHMSPTWRENSVTPQPQPESEVAKELLKKIKRFEKEARPIDPNTPVNSDEADHLVIQRNVYGKKGKWKRFPPEVLNRRKNKEGEWEDIIPS